MKKSKRIAATLAAFAAAITLSGCAANGAYNGEQNDNVADNIEIDAPTEIIPPATITPVPDKPETGQPPEEEDAPSVVVPSVKTVTYIGVTTNGVNIRSGAGTGYAARGVAEKSTLYAMNGANGGWYETGYKNKSAFISSKYCQQVEMVASEDERIEAIIAEGTKLLGTAYVFGAVRYHDGNGRLLKNFTTSEFDCSSLMQYIFS